MYADRQGAQILEDFEEPPPEELIARYNVAQVQGVLYAARDLVVELREGADARLVFHYVKVQGLIYALEPVPRGYRLRLDGPLSIFGATRKYGLRLARFLPGLLLTSPWRLWATVEWRDREAYLELDSETSGLREPLRGPRASKRPTPCASLRPRLGAREGHGRLGAGTGGRHPLLPGEKGPRLFRTSP